MDVNVINGIVRAILPAVFAYAVAKGWITDSQVGDVTVAIVTLVAVAWSVSSNWQKKPNG